MAKIKYTKNELKTQKDNLARFRRFLPTLELKKMQLIAEIRQIQEEMEYVRNEYNITEKNVGEWVGVFAEDVDLKGFFEIEKVVLHYDNIAGINVPVFDTVLFKEKEYDLYRTPLWVDRGLNAVKVQIKRKAEIAVLGRKEEILGEELRITVQRIKLFEEVKIPEALENIRVIQIFLGDQQTAAVVRGKIAKTKIAKKKMEERIQ
ncbi:MAG: V-type ATP synthase subunit D [bacterium]